MNKLASLLLVLIAAGPAVAPSLAADANESSSVVLITGANRGIGLELAKQYGEAGWHVIGTARTPASATDLRETGASIQQLDVTDADSVARLANDLEGQPIDLLINNAGIMPAQNTLSDADIDLVAMTLDVNTLGPMRVTQALLPNLTAGARKTIINMTSGLGSISRNTSGRVYGYRESKAALNMFTRSLAAELRDEGFIVLAMSPGWVKTDMGGPNARITPEESVSGMRSVIDSLTLEDTGKFRSYNDSEQPW